MNTIQSLNSLSAKTGIGGLISGMDIDELVKNLTATSRQKIIKQQQKVQSLEWKQEGYRSVIKSLTEFKSSYLDLLSPTNFRSKAFFNTTTASSDSPAVKATATPSAGPGTLTIDSITQLATNQIIRGSKAVSMPISGVLANEDISSLLNDIGGKSFIINLDGNNKVITLDQSFIDYVTENQNIQGLSDGLQAAVDQAFGIKDPIDRVIQVSISGDELSLTAEGSQLVINSIGDQDQVLTALGLNNGQSNRISMYQPLNHVSFAENLSSTDAFIFSINDVQFVFDNNISLSDIINEINNSGAGVTIGYSSITDSFTLTAEQSGVGENIIIKEHNGNLMKALGLTEESGATNIYGKNALLSINGKQITRSSNSFNIDGITLELNELSTQSINITLQEDYTALIDPIKDFIEDYNAMIEYINGLVKESVYSDFPPLTDEQKEEMTEAQIEKWEAKAKSGILRGDNILRGIASKLQTTMMSGSQKGGISLHALGISSTGYQENGKLTIDESKLMEALRSRGAEIADFFTSKEGLATRLYDIIHESTRTNGVEGKRGILVDMAGVEATSSDTQNSIFHSIERTNKNILSLQARLTEEEGRLWRQFTAMEAALQRLNEQSAILAQFISPSQ